jgi:hypothetical protein
MPEPPLLVLFLRREVMGNNLLSFLVITMDDGTDIDPSACDCRKNPNYCLATVIRRKSKSRGLTAHSFSAVNADDWNVAIFGAHCSRNFNDNSKTELPWLRVDFRNSEERAKFCKRFEECRDIFDAKMQDYYDRKVVATSKNIN